MGWCPWFRVTSAQNLKTRLQWASMIGLERQHQRPHHIWSFDVGTHFWSGFLVLLRNLSNFIRHRDIAALMLPLGVNRFPKETPRSHRFTAPMINPHNIVNTSLRKIRVQITLTVTHANNEYRYKYGILNLPTKYYMWLQCGILHPAVMYYIWHPGGILHPLVINYK